MGGWCGRGVLFSFPILQEGAWAQRKGGDLKTVIWQISGRRGAGFQLSVQCSSLSFVAQYSGAPSSGLGKETVVRAVFSLWALAAA